MVDSSPKDPRRTVALCYVRKSWTRDEKDAISPERQRKNIQAECDKHGWISEWYEDVDGHKSGMHENNRPGWLALKARMTQPDVVAIVANDLARLHRKGWRIGDLLDFVDKHKIKLIVADPERTIDFSTPTGRLFAQLSAIFDEWYAVDVSIRRKAEIAHRKSKGITVGIPPFGTKRDRKTGYLVPSNEGAWLLPDGTWHAGFVNEAPPIEGAIWRGYYECTEKILQQYGAGVRIGKICSDLQAAGWAFRDRQGQPSPLEKEDIRRVAANWAEYGGYVSSKRARQRHPADYPPDEIIAKLVPERAVFSVDLLAAVARSRHKRAFGKHPTRNVNRKARAYPLAGITFCFHCDQTAERLKSPKLRSLLSGHIGKYYRHKPGVNCGCHTKSVRREVFEEQFLKLVNALELKPESLQLMTKLAIQFNSVRSEDESLEEQKAAAIALCRRKIEAAVHLFGEGVISKEEYHRRIETNERDIESWNARTTEAERLQVEFSMCIAAIGTLTKLWSVSNDEDRQGMARQLFDYLVFDLDSQQIVDFRLKGWADQFLIARVGLLKAENCGDVTDENHVAPTGFEPVFWP